MNSAKREAAGRGLPAGARRPLTPKRIAVFVLKLILFIHLGYIGLTSAFIFAYKFVNPPFTVLMPYRAIGYGWKLQKPIPIALKKVPSYVRSMLVSVEDGKFYSHFGIDFEAFKRAREINEKVGKPLYGGSTLTMQVARTLFLVPEKSYVRKYFEVITALELELFLSKDRILELYFGYAEWGKGIFGIEAASRRWYGTGVASITRDQAARLIALLSSPIKYTPATLNKSGILRERYAYLTRRYIASQTASPDAETPAPPPPGDVEPGADVDADAAQTQGADGAALANPAAADGLSPAGGESGALSAGTSPPAETATTAAAAVAGSPAVTTVATPALIQ